MARPKLGRILFPIRIRPIGKSGPGLIRVKIGSSLNSCLLVRGLPSHIVLLTPQVIQRSRVNPLPGYIIDEEVDYSEVVDRTRKSSRRYISMN